jgi:hypothetical protein
MADRVDLAMGSALAGGVIAAALVETLFDKGILSLEESRAVLDKAIRALGPIMQQPGGLQAAQIIGGMQSGKFSARR